jgi:hypothetical protein
MIIVGTYPELSGSDDQIRALQRLRRAMDIFLPREVVVHLLPPYPSSGDEGFAPDDWFSVRPDLGSWSDVVAWAANRKLILDGVYNHVGQRHGFATNFFSSPSENGPIYAYRRLGPPCGQTSPRGGSVFREYTISGEVWQVWQTFSKASLDIRLSHPQVWDEVRRHLDFLVESGIYGVRLDGCAYFGHDLNVEQFHNPAGRAMAQRLTREAQARGLFAIGQLDADPEGASYFLKAEGWTVPVVDYAYSAVLVRALLSESASAMAVHVDRTCRLPCDVIRPPRTHDGILLQSDLLTKDELEDLARLCDQWNLPVRSANGENYEINASLPFICSLGVGEEAMWRRVLLITFLTGFLSGTPYFYLPFIVCDVPERRVSFAEGDPRSLNRTRLPAGQLEAFYISSRSGQLRDVLRVIGEIRTLHPNEEISASVPLSEPGDSVLVLARDSGRCVFACNLSASRPVAVALPDEIRFAWGIGASDRMLEPLGFGIWRPQPSAA